jgi:hypothetical protein
MLNTAPQTHVTLAASPTSSIILTVYQCLQTTGTRIPPAEQKLRNQKTKTYNRRDSQMVTHSSTSRPVQCLCMAEQTGCPVLTDLWSYVP